MSQPPEDIPPQDIHDLEIREGGIRLGQVLKLAGLAESGADAKALLEAHAVTVDGEVETRRGRQLHKGAVITIDGESIRLV